MRIEVSNIYEGMEFDIIPLCETDDAGVTEFFELLVDDDIKGYKFWLVDDDA